MAVQFSWLYVGGGTALGKSGYGLGTYSDPLNPLNLPPYTARFKFSWSDYDPTANGDTWKTGSTWTRVSTEPNIWDYHHASTDWSFAFYQRDRWSTNTTFYVSMMGANTTGVTNMRGMYGWVKIVDPLPIFDTSSVVNMSYMFEHSHFIREDSLPLFDTSNVTTMSNMFAVAHFPLTYAGGFPLPAWDTHNVTDMSGMFQQIAVPGIYGSVCIPSSGWDTSNVVYMNGMFHYANYSGIENLNTHNVKQFSYMFSNSNDIGHNGGIIYPIDTTNAEEVTEMYSYNGRTYKSGIYNMYLQLSSNPKIPSYAHDNCFYQCGNLTTAGQAELAQIPQDWGGTMA